MRYAEIGMSGPEFDDDQYFLDDAANKEALERALVFIREQAEGECYIMCDCDDLAEKALKDIAKRLGVSVERLKRPL